MKKHPESLLVTARNKMKAATTFKKSVSLGGRRIETVRLSGTVDSLGRNESALESLLASLGPSNEPANRMAWPGWREVGKSVIADYLDALVTDQGELIWTGNNLQTFVRNTKSPSMQKWDVVLVNGRKSGTPEQRPRGVVPSRPSVRSPCPMVKSSECRAVRPAWPDHRMSRR